MRGALPATPSTTDSASASTAVFDVAKAEAKIAELEALERQAGGRGDWSEAAKIKDRIDAGRHLIAVQRAAGGD